MPWTKTCPMNERTKLVTLYETGKFTVMELAELFGVSRKTANKWLSRYRMQGPSGLVEQSSAPHCHPNATSTLVAAAVLRAKAAHPTWGPAKLFPGPDDPPEVAAAWPAVSTRGAILGRQGLVKPRHRRRHVAPWTQPFQEATSPNAVWCVDFKGWFRTQDGQRCDPLTVSDAFSRMFLCCRIVPRPDHAHARPVFERLFREYGLPLAIRSDNGAPFASMGIGGLSTLSVWWVKLGIVPERIAPGHPEQNGRHERLHGTLKRETMQPPSPTPRAQQRRIDAFVHCYNTERPHQALGQVPPATLYVPSARPYPHRLTDPTYLDSAQTRRVRQDGQIKWHGTLVWVSEALAGELVGITEERDSWMVSYGPIALGLLRPNHIQLDRLPPTSRSEQMSVTYVPS